MVDPMAGAGTILVEAAALGRRAIGVEVEGRWVDLARANIEHVLDARHQARADVIQADARILPDLLGQLTGRVDLIATSPPYACDAGVIDKPAWRQGKSLCDKDSLNYSSAKANLGHARGQVYLEAMAEIYAACHEVLRPGGLLVTVTKNTRRAGRCFDLAGATVALAQEAGLSYLQHVVALLGAIRDGALVARPSFWQLTQHRRALARGEPAHLVVHEDVCIFSKAPAAVDSEGTTAGRVARASKASRASDPIP
ncbi:MAG: TRM11 family SAM-dependent methyltransferase [Acidimicrobiales bacterium]